MAKILLVDDSATIRLALKKPLETAGHLVTEAEDGAEALTKVNAAPKEFDLILTDINMPNMDGLTFCQKVKAADDSKHIPVVVISTETSPAMKARGKEIGVTAWMTKPPNPAKLIEAVEKIIAIQMRT